jgi:hypothetical protein
MKNKLKVFGIAVIIMVIEFSIIACDNADGGGNGTNNGGNGVTLNKNSIFLIVGGTETLTATVSPSNATNKTVGWSTSNPNVATVTYGTINALSLGSATITVTTAEGSKTAACTVTVMVAPTITTTALPDGVVGSAYSQTLTATGDTPITYSIESGTLPQGLSLVGSTGIISGTPTTVGTSTFTVKAANAASSNTKTLSVTIKTWIWTAITKNVFVGNSVKIWAIAYGNGKFVAGGNNGKMAYSTDGVTWTAVADSTFGTTIIWAIAYGNGKFVAGGDNGKMATSTGGETWTGVDIGTLFDYTSGSNTYKDRIGAIAYGNGKFVAGSTRGKMAWSTDGVTWTEINSNLQNLSLTSIAYGNGKFVAGGNNGEMAYSTDGVTWTEINSNLQNLSLTSIAYGNGKFVAGGNNGKMAYSTDCITWTTIPRGTDAGASKMYKTQAIVYGNDKFVAVGEYNGEMATSTDGITWLEVTQSVFGSYVSITSIGYGNGRFIASGNNNESILIMAYSEN